MFSCPRSTDQRPSADVWSLWAIPSLLTLALESSLRMLATPLPDDFFDFFTAGEVNSFQVGNE